MIFCRNRASKIYTSSVEHLLKRLSSSSVKETATDEKEMRLQSSPMMTKTILVLITPDYNLSRSPRYVELPDGTSTLVFWPIPKALYRTMDAWACIVGLKRTQNAKKWY
jgi:hypothetical protein